MRRTAPVVMLMIAAMLALLLLPASAFATLTNQYGMKYTGTATCENCHGSEYADTTHGNFAQVGADPSAEYMWPAGRTGLGEMVQKDEVAFTLGAGTGLREYLVLNPNGGTGSVSTPVSFVDVKGVAPYADRYGTAVESAKKAFPAGADAVVVATGENYPDALGGSALAGAVNGPILLTKKASIRADVLAEIDALNPSKIYVLGSTDSVSGAVETALAAVAPVTRISGGNRYETAGLIAEEVITILGDSFNGTAFVVSGNGYADALAGAPIAFKKGMPILLASSGGVTVPEGVTDAVILGNGVSPAIQTALDAQLDTVDRKAGGDRYATAALVAQYGMSLGMSWDNVGIATGESFPDALAGGPLMGSKNTVLLLTKSGGLSGAASSALSTNKAAIFKAHYIGGALSDACRAQVAAVLPPHVVALPGDPNPFVVPAMEWDPAEADIWEIGPGGIEFENYTCQPCHHLGAVSQNKKPTVGTFVSTATTGTANAWVTSDKAGDPTTSPEKYVAGSSIQCEVCHGTGQASPAVSNHFNNYTDYVKILVDQQLLDSQVCGQCHGTAKSKSMFGYTPDQNINLFATWFKATDVPTEASFTVNPSGYKFYPNGQNKGNKHSYYTEWTMSGHSYRGALTKTDPRASVYQAAGNGHYNATTSSLDCAKCHTGEGYAKRKNMKFMQNVTLTNANVGNYGQECATCHMPHNAGTENGMAVRQPDAATTYAGITMTSICEDCHNWQLEMTTGASIPTTFATPPAALTQRGGFSHPTREIYNGRGMFEVANADKFMPGVKCEECHMPATRSDFPDKTGLTRYEQRSYKRYSHRMFIMEPGKAADWGLAPYGDSCSPCHPGETQDELQADIETWQDEAAEAASEASAAYAAAYAAAPGSGENTGSVQFKALMGRAYYNYRNYLGEGSLGAHNPEYIIAGLDKATQLAESVNGSFAFATVGSAYPGVDYVMGTVHNGDGSGAANAKLVINVNGGDQTVYSDANGNFLLTYPSGGAGFNSILWKRCSDSAADLLWD